MESKISNGMNNTKKFSFVFIILLVLIISLFVVINEKKEVLKDNTTQQEKNMNTKENLHGSGVYTLDPVSSKIIWEGKKTLIKEWVDSGNISVQSGDVTLVDDKITGAKITIDMNSITAQKTGAGQGEDGLSKHLKSADFFGVENFPTSEFILTSLIPSGKEYEYYAKGNITIKNITKTIEFPMTIYMGSESMFLNAEIVLDRTQFDVRYGSTSFFNDIGDKAINNEFVLKLELIAKKS